MPRRCLTCGLTETEVAFPKNRSYCKPCWSVQQAAYRAIRPDANRAYREKYKPKRRIRLSQNAAYIQAQQRAYLDTHKEHINAWKRAYDKTPARREARKTWKANNQAHLQSYLRAYNAGRREAQRAYMEKYYADHREEWREYSKQYAAEHPEKIHEYRRRRHERIHKDPHSDLTYAQWLEILAAYDYRCVYCPPSCVHCRKRSHDELTQDHITPIIKGGHHTRSNIVPACRSCNSRKRDRPVPVPIQPLLLTLAPPKTRERS